MFIKISKSFSNKILLALMMEKIRKAFAYFNKHVCFHLTLSTYHSGETNSVEKSSLNELFIKRFAILDCILKYLLYKSLFP